MLARDVTAPAVLALLRKAGGPLTTCEIHYGLGTDTVSLDTVRRALKFLEADGLVTLGTRTVRRSTNVAHFGPRGWRDMTLTTYAAVKVEAG